VGLPLKRDVQHHIDLIPGFILPNKLAYRINPKDTIEIQRQVEKLKGLNQGVFKSLCRACSFGA